MEEIKEAMEIISRNIANIIERVIKANMQKISNILEDKAFDLKMLVDTSIISEETDITNGKFVDLSKKLDLTSIYITDGTGITTHYNGPETIGLNIYELDRVFKDIKKGA